MNDDDVVRALAEVLNATYLELVETQERLNDVNQQLEAYQQLQGERLSLGARLQHLSQEYRGIEIALNRRRGDAPGPSVLPNTDWLNLSRPQAVYRVLAENRKPMRPAEIREALTAHGREGDQARGVSVALMRLRKRGQVYPISRGQWALGPDPMANPDAFDNNEGEPEEEDK